MVGGAARPERGGLADELGVLPPITNPFRSILVRGLETIFTLGEAARIARDYRYDGDPAVPFEPRASVGFGATEAPRGLLWHRYDIDADGMIEAAAIVPPTSQNQLSIEEDLRAIAPDLLALDLDTARARAEQTIRNYDPCISCATHFLRFERRVT